MGDASMSSVPILDIRLPESSIGSLADGIRRSMNPPPGTSKSLSTLLLYDEKGLRIFEDITYLEEYYLTNAEIEALQINAATIAAQLPSGIRLLELGSGNLRKVEIILKAFEAAGKDVEYFALDLSLPELERTFALLDTARYKHVRFNGLHGTYDDALSWISKHAASDDRRTICILTLGSSLGNFSPQDAAQFLSSFAHVIGPSDRILVGIDACHESDKVYQAYNDKAGVTTRFYENGLENANRLLGYPAFQRQDWRIETAYDSEDHKHHAWYVAVKDIETRDFAVKSGEIVTLEESWKFPRDRQNQIWREAGLINTMEFSNKSGDYQIHLLSPTHLEFKEKAEEYAPSPIPSIGDWENLWAAWDTVTKGMVPEDELLNKPIKLRNDLIFYLGHIPAFADIHHTKATGDSYVEPASFPKMFERGIDPDVDDPSKCHDHSEIPDSWPSLAELTEYQDRIRARFVDSIGSGRVETDRRLGRAYWLAYEHEAMHLETFLYMLIQSNRVLAPPGYALPDFERLASEAAERRAQNGWHHIPGGKISMGLEDAENDEGPDRFFGWDIERPPRVAQVKPFEAQSRPISNGEYALFLEETHAETLPASWIAKKTKSLVYTNGTKSPSVNGTKVASDSFVDGKSIRTVYGPLPLKFALDWPVMASYDELAQYAKWANGRIPTVEEARTIYNFVERKMQALEKPGELISAVNGHLVNDGVEETPPSHHAYQPPTAALPSPKPTSSISLAAMSASKAGRPHQ
ncbi:uncharacterized protein AB675_4514 [Cyphellophora attinorum]|uniref:Ergothioneine biosynthesis protein 1 n=1 Tax=Cyphellophora attinorum TaxID=1664694 RepID=A0A0N1H860_9EURO|nr:uncharacterized protein AB675_4514 [Phialophora attinorum]KPI39163.1 hypothetical protein AB675_4514 [Phialophora attinorum]